MLRRSINTPALEGGTPMKNRIKQALQAAHGFTLVELIVVLVILGIVASFAVPALSGYIKTSHERQAVSEAQACVMAATTAATAARSAKTADEFATWAGGTKTNDTATQPTGALFLSEGRGGYYVADETGGLLSTGFATGSVIEDTEARAGVPGRIVALELSDSGQVLYLKYQNATNSITVCYSNKGGSGVTIPPIATPAVPSPSIAPPSPTANPAVRVTLQAVDKATHNTLQGATLTVNGVNVRADGSQATELLAGNHPVTAVENPNGYRLATDSIAVTTAGEYLVEYEQLSLPLTFAKVDDADKPNPVAGAELTLTGTNGYRQTWTTPSSQTNNPRFALPVGSYTLTETKTPTGFNTAAPIAFDVVDNGGTLTARQQGASGAITGTTVSMVDKPYTADRVIIWAVYKTPDGRYIPLDGVPLKLTGGSSGDLSTQEKRWTSSAAAGKEYTQLKANSSAYQVRIAGQDDIDNKDNAQAYQNANPLSYYLNPNDCKLDFTINQNGEVVLTGSADNGAIVETVVDGQTVKQIYLFVTPITPPQDTLDLTLHGSGVSVTISGILPWPSYSSGSIPLSAGALYYTGDSANPSFWAVLSGCSIDASHTTPQSLNWAVTPLGDGKMNLWSDESLHYENYLCQKFEIFMGDFLVHGDRLYQYMRNPGGMSYSTFPGTASGDWREVGNPYTIKQEQPNVRITIADAATGNPLTGAELTLRDSSGNILYGSVNDPATSSKTTYLPAGSYTLEQAAYGKHPVNYDALSDPFPFTVSGAGTTQVTVPYSPTQGKLNLSARYTQNGKSVPLAGAVLRVSGTSLTQAVVDATFTTNENGSVTAQLPLGEYRVAHNTAPDGFVYQSGNTDKHTVGLHYTAPLNFTYTALPASVSFTRRDAVTNAVLELGQITVTTALHKTTPPCPQVLPAIGTALAP